MHAVDGVVREDAETEAFVGVAHLFSSFSLIKKVTLAASCMMLYLRDSAGSISDNPALVWRSEMVPNFSCNSFDYLAKYVSVNGSYKVINVERI